MAFPSHNQQGETQNTDSIQVSLMHSCWIISYVQHAVNIAHATLFKWCTLVLCCQMEVVQGTTYSLNGFTRQQLSDSRRQYSWERGQIDYLGIDSFDNILSQLDAKLH